MGNPYYTPIDEQSGKSYQDVVSEDEDTTGADYDSDSDFSQPPDITSDRKADVISDGVADGNTRPGDQSTSGGGSSSDGSSGSSGGVGQPPDVTTDRKADVISDGLRDGDTSKQTNPVEDEPLNPTSMDRLNRAESVIRDQYPGAKTVSVTGAGGGAVDVRVVGDNGATYQGTLFDGGDGELRRQFRPGSDPYRREDLRREARRADRNQESLFSPNADLDPYRREDLRRESKRAQKGQESLYNPSEQTVEQAAQTKLEGKLEDKTGVDLTPGEDFSVERFDGGFRGVLTESGREKFQNSETPELTGWLTTQQVAERTPGYNYQSGAEQTLVRKIDEQFPGADISRSDIEISREQTDGGEKLIADLNRSGRKKVSVQRAPFQNTPLEQLTEFGAGVRFEGREFRRQNRNEFKDLVADTGRGALGTASEIGQYLDPMPDKSANIKYGPESATRENIAGAAAVGVVAPEPISTGAGLAIGGALALGAGLDAATRPGAPINANRAELSIPSDQGAGGEIQLPEQPTSSQAELSPTEAGLGSSELESPGRPIGSGVRSEFDVPDQAPSQQVAEIGTFRTNQLVGRQQSRQKSDESSIDEELDRMERARRGEFVPGAGSGRQEPGEPDLGRINRPRGGVSRSYRPDEPTIPVEEYQRPRIFPTGDEAVVGRQQEFASPEVGAEQQSELQQQFQQAQANSLAVGEQPGLLAGALDRLDEAQQPGVRLDSLLDLRDRAETTQFQQPEEVQQSDVRSAVEDSAETAPATAPGLGYGLSLERPSLEVNAPVKGGEPRKWRLRRPRGDFKTGSERVSEGGGGLRPPEAEDRPLIQGWYAETVTALALGGTLDRSAPQSALEDQPFGVKITGELPTGPQLSGSKQEKRRIEEAYDLLSGANLGVEL